MGIHLPLSLKAQAEARILTLSINNFLLPSTGETNIYANQEIVLGCYYLTTDSNNLNYLFKTI